MPRNMYDAGALYECVMKHACLGMIDSSENMSMENLENICCV